MSNKLSKRRATVRKPKICVAAAAAAAGTCPGPECECFFDEDELEMWTDETHLFVLYVCCPDLGNVYGTAVFTATGGWWTDPDHEVMNCTRLEDLEYNSGANPGNYTLTCTITFPGPVVCVATIDVLVKEQEP